MRVELDDLLISPEVVEMWSHICAHAVTRLHVLASHADEPPHIGEEYGLLEPDGQLTINCDLRIGTLALTITSPPIHTNDWRWREQVIN